MPVASLADGFSVFAPPRNVLRGITEPISLSFLAAADLCQLLGNQSRTRGRRRVTRSGRRGRRSRSTASADVRSLPTCRYSHFQAL